MTQQDSETRILVVEDDPTIRRCIELCLTSGERHVDLRSDGDSGLAAARELDPDLLILDLALPGMDGWEILRTLRVDDDDDMAILVLTAVVGRNSRERAEIGGANAFMTKPFRPAELRAVVDHLITR